MISLPTLIDNEASAQKANLIDSVTALALFLPTPGKVILPAYAAAEYKPRHAK